MVRKKFVAIAFLAGAFSNGRATEIDLGKPVAQSVPEITGIYWNFDEELGPQQMFLDASGHGNDGTPVAGNGASPELVEGVNRPGVSGFGKAVRLSTSEPMPGEQGNPRVYANMGVTNSLALLDVSFTGGIWVRFFSVRSGENQTVVLIDKGGFNTKAGENAGHFCLFLVKGKDDAWQVGFQAGDGLENATVFHGPPQICDFSDGEWHHIGFNFDFDRSAGNKVSFWVDGELVGTESVNVSLTSGSNNTGARRFFVGERVTTRYVSTFDGAVDDVFVTEGHFDFKSLPKP